MTIILDSFVPFSKKKANPKAEAVCEYGNDMEFKDILVNPRDYVRYQGFVSPDCFVYRDMPFHYRLRIFIGVEILGISFKKIWYMSFRV